MLKINSKTKILFLAKNNGRVVALPCFPHSYRFILEDLAAIFSIMHSYSFVEITPDCKRYLLKYESQASSAKKCSVLSGFLITLFRITASFQIFYLTIVCVDWLFIHYVSDNSFSSIKTFKIFILLLMNNFCFYNSVGVLLMLFSLFTVF